MLQVHFRVYTQNLIETSDQIFYLPTNQLEMNIRATVKLFVGA